MTGKQEQRGIKSQNGKMIADSQGRYRILVGNKAINELSECAQVTLADIERIAARIFQTCLDSGLMEEPPFHIFIEAMPGSHPKLPQATMSAARIGKPGFEVEGVRFDRAIQIFETAIRQEMKATAREIEGAYGKAGVPVNGDAQQKIKDGIITSQTTVVLMNIARELARLLAADASSARLANRALKEVDLLTDALVFEAFRQDYEGAEMYAKNGFLAALGCLCDVVEAERTPQGSFQRFHAMRKKARQIIEGFKKETPQA